MQTKNVSNISRSASASFSTDDENKMLLRDESGLINIPEQKLILVAPAREASKRDGEFSVSLEPKQFALPVSRNAELFIDVQVPVRDIINRIPLFDAPFSSIFSEHSDAKLNAMGLKIMEMGMSNEQALIGLILTNASGVSNAVNAIFEFPPIPAPHHYIAVDSYVGDDVVRRHSQLYDLNELGYEHWPWNVPDGTLCALCGLPEELFHKGKYQLKKILSKSKSETRSPESDTLITMSNPEPVQKNWPNETKVGEISDLITCGICWDEMDKEKIFLAPCGHFYCNDCLKQHYQTKIMDGDVLRLPCPYVDDWNLPCDREIEENEILLFCGEEMKAKFLKFKENRLVQLNERARFCPQPGCPGYALGSKWKPKLICTECGYIYCWKCSNQFHGYFSKCVSNNDGLFIMFTLGKDIQSCPKCKVKIWKNDGCNHMTCKFCSYEYCWICRGKYNENHYAIWNLMGCPGGLYLSWVRCPGFCPSYVNRFLVVIFIIGVIVPILLCIMSLMSALFVALVSCWLACWIITCIPGTYVDPDYITPCGCRDLLCE